MNDSVRSCHCFDWHIGNRSAVPVLKLKRIIPFFRHSDSHFPPSPSLMYRTTLGVWIFSIRIDAAPFLELYHSMASITDHARRVGFSISQLTDSTAARCWAGDDRGFIYAHLPGSPGSQNPSASR